MIEIQKITKIFDYPMQASIFTIFLFWWDRIRL